MNGFIITGKDGVQRPLRREDIAPQNPNPWAQRVSETWSVNSNSPGQINYSRTVTQSYSYYTTEAELQAHNRRMNEWLQQQWAITNRHTRPAKRPSVIIRIVKALIA